MTDGGHTWQPSVYTPPTAFNPRIGTTTSPNWTYSSLIAFYSVNGRTCTVQIHASGLTPSSDGESIEVHMPFNSASHAVLTATVGSNTAVDHAQNAHISTGNSFAYLVKYFVSTDTQVLNLLDTDIDATTRDLHIGGSFFIA